MIKRLFIEKKKGFDTEARNLKKELNEKLKLKEPDIVRIIDRYDIEGIPETEYEKIKSLVFFEQGLDDIHEEEFVFPDNAFVFGVEDLPGQYDQRADSAEEAIRMIVPGADVCVRRARFYIIQASHCGSGPFTGGIGEDDKAKLLKYLINPTDTRKASFEKPLTLKEVIPSPPDVAVCQGFRELDESEYSAFVDEMGFAMNEDDLRFVQGYFRDEEKRDPTVTELRAIDTYWSDHCRHTTFLTQLADISFEGGAYPALVKEAYDEYLGLREEVYGENAGVRPVTMMDMATIGAKYFRKIGKLEDLDESEEVNACSIKIKAEIVEKPGDAPVSRDWLFMFKNETHNHPTEIEPFGGAGTCLGGGIRDPLSGRAFVHQAMRITGSGDPRTSIEETLPGKLPQYYITRTAAKGYSSYGNQVGGTSGFIEEIYDEGYVAKRMELGALVAAAPAENVVRGIPAPGDAILLVGGRTGRDGIGAATGSSKEQTKESITTAGAEVQKGNPAIESNIIRLYRRPEAARLIKRCNDFGAGGVSVAIGELAPSIDVELDKVPAKYDGLDGTELAVSESQERMAVVIARDDLDTFLAYATEENLEATQVAVVTDTGRFRMNWRGKRIFDLSRKFLDTNGAPQKRSVRVSDKQDWSWRNVAKAKQSREVLLEALEDLNNASKRGLIEQFDSTIGAGTLLMPLGGKAQMTPSLGMAAKLPVLSGDTYTATLMAYGFDPAIAKKSPFHSAMYAVLDSCARICAMGGDMEKIRLSFQEFFPRLGNETGRWAVPVSALLGALKAEKGLGAASIGGKDSMSGTFHDIDVPPTLASFAVCTADARKIVSPELKKSGSSLVLLVCPRNEFLIPDFEAFLKNAKRVFGLIKEGKVLAANTVPYGGLFAAISKMAIGNGIGARLETKGDVPSVLLSESYGSLLLEIPGDEDPEALFSDLSYQVVGRTLDSGSIEIVEEAGSEGVVISLEEIIERLEMPLAEVFPVEANVAGLDCASHSAPQPSSSSDFAGARPSDSQRKSSDDYGCTPRPKYETTIGTTKPDASDCVLDCASGSDSAGLDCASGLDSAGLDCAPALLTGAKPRVVIPVFTGTVGENDCKRAFERAGADVVFARMLSREPGEVQESIKRAAEAIKNCQITVLPGGASYGEEPGGSSKMTMAVMRNPYMAEAFSQLLDKNGGLVLGIGSGFQALVKLGLLPYGKFTEPGEDGIFITRNTIGRHMSKIVRVRVCSTLSPWYAGAEKGDTHSMPVSIMEGRFTANKERFEDLAEKGQIATQFADLSGEVSCDILYNPCGSAFAVEAITSPDGRILGRIGHAERNAPGLYLNVPGNYDESVFKSGVEFFL